MAWAKVDDDAPLSRKFFRAGVAAFGLDVAAWCYCNREGTDGYVPSGDLPIVFPGLSLPRAVALAAKLVEVGRWSKDGDGYRIHDFHEYQFSAEQIAESRRKRAESGRLGGLKSGEVRRSKPPSKDEAFASSAAKQMLNPDPDPDPDREPPRARPPAIEREDSPPDQPDGLLTQQGSGSNDHDSPAAKLARVQVAARATRQQSAGEVLRRLGSPATTTPP